ncbi:hypothetical protein [Nocardioides sp. AX2bis]|uniref:hypothetical protein n=1 Tax=Nocardioides sp. AX2bis TaxID=2653157 RepID=UPI0012F400B8|nr:hypothetical protein [Nocardioides sp. AX2bis]VXC55353.1 hypothetical protein NOCARDAX2BIS_90001 [Nocardioides sp. AX2bis]
MSAPEPQATPPSQPPSPAQSSAFPSVVYLVVTGVVAVIGLGLAFAAVVPSIVGVISMLPLLVGLQQIGVRKRAERQEKKVREARDADLG